MIAAFHPTPSTSDHYSELFSARRPGIIHGVVVRIMLRRSPTSLDDVPARLSIAWQRRTGENSQFS
jgi:hypothetical protein